MLIEIDGSAIQSALAGSTRSRECIEGLLRSHERGKHVLWLDRGRAEALIAIEATFSGLARNALRNVLAQRHEIQALARRMRWSIKLGVGAAFHGSAISLEGREILHVDLHLFDDDERSGRAVLLGEHLRDAALYVAIGRAFAAAHGWRVELNFEPRLGGGGTTAAAFGQLVRDGRIVLAIVDSDRKLPGGPRGATAAALSRVAKTVLQHVHEIHVRSAENLIPSAVYEEAFKAPPANALTLNQQGAKLVHLENLKEAERKPSTQLWREHAELKFGLRWFEVQQMAPGSSEAVFWSSVAGELDRDHCTRTQPCASLATCQCYVTDPLGSDALHLAETWLTPKDRVRNARLLGLDRLPHGAPLGDLCEKIVAWGLALRR